MNIGSLVIPSNYHGEPVEATFTLGMGVVRELYIDPIDGEGKAAVEFSDSWGIWPVECLKVIKREPVTVSMIDPPRRSDDDQPTPEGF